MILPKTASHTILYISIFRTVGGVIALDSKKV